MRVNGMTTAADIAECEAAIRDGLCLPCGMTVRPPLEFTRVEDVIKMTRVAFVRLNLMHAIEEVPESATIVYYDPRNGSFAYHVPKDNTGYKPFTYFCDSSEPSFDTEAEMLAQFVIDMASL